MKKLDALLSRDVAKKMINDGKSWSEIIEVTHLRLKDLKDIDVNNEEDFINKIAPNFALKGEFNAIPDIKTFLSPYLTATELSTLNDIENSEFFVRNSDKLSLKFAYDPQKIDILINDKIFH